CKGPEYHSKLCALGQLARTLLPAVKGRRGRQETVADRKLISATMAVGPGQAKSVELAAEIEPGTAGKVGVRIGRDQSVEVALAGDRLLAAGVPIPFAFQPHDNKTLNWHIVVDDGRLTIYANSRVRLLKAVKVDAPGAVTLFAENGSAEFKKVDVWELKAKP
ncbi:MAG TPA: hypothetical protein VM098_09160, partial [Phycisphaerae bacterium]|nr:hypothetical protein [Phycisphaerae bacterium]